MQPNNSFKLAASLICADMLNLEQELRILEQGGIDQIHFDVMDGNFVPRLGLHPEMLQGIRQKTQLPIDVHLMIDKPELYIPLFAKAGADYIVVHAESTKHLDYMIRLIREHGSKAGVALNPSTPLAVLDYILDDIELVMLMAINPGIVGHKLIPRIMEKIKELKHKLTHHKHIQIQMDGGVTPETAAAMIKNGADILVCGSATIFKPHQPRDEKIKELRSSITMQISQDL